MRIRVTQADINKGNAAYERLLYKQEELLIAEHCPVSQALCRTFGGKIENLRGFSTTESRILAYKDGRYGSAWRYNLQEAVGDKIRGWDAKLGMKPFSFSIPDDKISELKEALSD